MEITTKPRPCERCCATIDTDFGSDGSENYHPMCTEIVLAYGVVSWICYDCRKDWHRVINENPLTKEYSEVSLRYDYWKATVAASGQGDVEFGLQLWKQLDDLERKLNNFANQWIKDDGLSWE